MDPLAELLKRVFARDELTCERCGSRMQVIAYVRRRESVRKFLGAVGVSAEVPVVAPAEGPTVRRTGRARSPPQLELWN